MKLVRVRNVERDCEIGDQVMLANRWWPRLRGLIGRPEPGKGQGMLIMPSQGVHMYWMKYPLDVALLDKTGRIVAVYPELQPGKRTRFHRDAVSALELPAGHLASTGTREGDLLEWTENGRTAA